MIYYATKETMQRYKLKTPEEFESPNAPLVQLIKQVEAGDPIYEWGCKLFYFDRRKCLQFMHFETRLVIYLVDVKVKEIGFAANALANYLMDMYDADEEMCRALETYFASSPVAIYDRITNRSVISHMNTTLSRWACDGYLFYDYVVDGVLLTRQINRDVNEVPARLRIDGKETSFLPYDYFAERIKARFFDSTPKKPCKIIPFPPRPSSTPRPR